MNKIDALNYQLIINLFRTLYRYERNDHTAESAIHALLSYRKIFFDDMVKALEEVIDLEENK